jgi:hypothetical protein
MIFALLWVDYRRENHGKPDGKLSWENGEKQ